MSATLRDTATTSTRARFAWVSGSAIAPVVETLMPTLVGIQCLESMLKKFQKHKLRSEDEHSYIKAKNETVTLLNKNVGRLICWDIKTVCLAADVSSLLILNKRQDAWQSFMFCFLNTSSVFQF